VTAVEHRTRFVAADLHGDTFRNARVHEVSDGRPAEVVNDEPSYLYHGKLPSGSGLTSVRVPSPRAAQAFCYSVRRFVSEKTFPTFGSISASIICEDSHT
jgi:hypothetical protein